MVNGRSKGRRASRNSLQGKTLPEIGVAFKTDLADTTMVRRAPAQGNGRKRHRGFAETVGERLECAGEIAVRARNGVPGRSRILVRGVCQIAAQRGRYPDWQRRSELGENSAATPWKRGSWLGDGRGALGAPEADGLKGRQRQRVTMTGGRSDEIA